MLYIPDNVKSDIELLLKDDIIRNLVDDAWNETSARKLWDIFYAEYLDGTRLSIAYQYIFAMLYYNSSLAKSVCDKFVVDLSNVYNVDLNVGNTFISAHKLQYTNLDPDCWYQIRSINDNDFVYMKQVSLENSNLMASSKVVTRTDLVGLITNSRDILFLGYMLIK